MTSAISSRIWIARIHAAAFLCGLCCLSLEVLAMRYLSAIFGSTSYVWTAALTVTLGGLALGYYAGGRMRSGAARKVLCATLAVVAALCASTQWSCWALSEYFETYSMLSIYGVAVLAFGPASIGFGLTTPMLIAIRAHGSGEPAHAHAGGLYAVSTAGSLCGAILTTHWWVPFVGLARTSLILGALLLLAGLLVAFSWAVPACCIFLARPLQPPLPLFEGVALVEEDTEYSRVRLLHSPPWIAFGVGPACESLYDLDAERAASPYARRIIDDLVETRRDGGRALIIGGAGNVIGLELARAAWAVDVCEIDGRIAELSDRYFGAFGGRWVIDDGRAFLRWSARPSSYDVVVIDAFIAPGILAPHLVTLEALQDVRRALADRGVLVLNAMATLGGDRRLLDGLGATLAAVFPEVELRPVTDAAAASTTYQNVLFFAAKGDGVTMDERVGRTHAIVTDDRNPVEAYCSSEQMRVWSGRSIRGGWHAIEEVVAAARRSDRHLRR